MTKIFTVANMPQDLAQAWLQHLRDFDTAHTGCHFEVAAEAPDATLAQTIEALRVDPALTFTAIYARAPAPKNAGTPNRSAVAMRSFKATNEYRQTLVPLATLEVWADGIDALEHELADRRAELDRGYQQLELRGVPRERAKTLGNGIDVLATRYDKEVACAQENFRVTNEAYCKLDEKLRAVESRLAQSGQALAWIIWYKDSKPVHVTRADGWEIEVVMTEPTGPDRAAEPDAEKPGVAPSSRSQPPV